MPTETSQTLDRGLRVLGALAAAPDGLTVTELAAALGVNRTIVYRLVTTLEQHALVRREPGGRIQVGLGVLHLASAVHPVLREAAVPVLRELADAVGCTAHLTVADGGEALAIAVVEPTRTDFHVSYRVGTRHALEAGAAGKAILLGRDEESTEPYVTTVGELQRGARGIAAPLGSPDLEASVGVVTLGEVDEAEVGDAVLDAARRLAAILAAV